MAFKIRSINKEWGWDVFDFDLENDPTYQAHGVAVNWSLSRISFIYKGKEQTYIKDRDTDEFYKANKGRPADGVDEYAHKLIMYVQYKYLNPLKNIVEG